MPSLSWLLTTLVILSRYCYCYLSCYWTIDVFVVIIVVVFVLLWLLEFKPLHYPSLLFITQVGIWSSLCCYRDRFRTWFCYWFESNMKYFSVFAPVSESPWGKTIIFGPTATICMRWELKILQSWKLLQFTLSCFEYWASNFDKFDAMEKTP